MPEYIITPDKRDIPSSHLLSEELHRRAISVEMEVKGTNYKWESIHFYDPAIPETQCFVERNLNSHVFKISLPFDSTHESAEIQHALVEIFLHEVGGAAFDVEAKQSYDLKHFRGHTKGSSSDSELSGSKNSSSGHSFKLSITDGFWLVFAWAFVFFGLYIYLHTSDDRKMLYLAADILALVGAVGLTYSLTRSK